MRNEWLYAPNRIIAEHGSIHTGVFMSLYQIVLNVVSHRHLAANASVQDASRDMVTVLLFVGNEASRTVSCLMRS